MNALLKKEIRLLLPAWVAALLLTLSPLYIFDVPYFQSDPDEVLRFLPFLFLAGTTILAISSFGREFSLGTFSLLLAQPNLRKKIWLAKVAVLAVAVISVLIAYFAICELQIQIWTFYPGIIQGHLSDDQISGALIALITLAGGLWSTLLIRQTVAAFWITLAAPYLIFLVLGGWADCSVKVVGSALVIYSLIGLWWSWRLFSRAQDAQWTGGNVSLSVWPFSRTQSRSSSGGQRRHPIAALIQKEFQLHHVTLFGMVGLFVLNLGVITVQKIGYNSLPQYTRDVLECFGALWFVVPLVVGGTSIAEERKLGMMDGQLCLPVSSRIQFTVKFFFALIVGGLFAAILFWAAGKIGLVVGVKNNFFENGGRIWRVTASVSIIFLIIAAISFYASTLTRNILQAMGVAILTTLGCIPFFSFVNHKAAIFGITLWHSILPSVVAIPTITAALMWLAWLNFKTTQEDRRLWRRNIFGIASALVLIVAGSAAIYNRAWEIFETAEPPHGSAKFPLANPPKLQNETYNGNLLVRLPDGRVWFDSLSSPFPFGNQHNLYQPSRWKMLWSILFPSLPKNTGPQQFIAGSNWVSVTALHIDQWDVRGRAHSKPIEAVGYLDTVGIKTDGTLWISSEAKPVVWTGDRMVRFGNETNWQQVVGSHWGGDGGLLLLKNDGTLWRWGRIGQYFGFYAEDFWTNGIWPTVRNTELYQTGNNSDRKEICSFQDDLELDFDLIRKSDGTVWAVDDNLRRETNLDQVSFQTLSFMENQPEAAYVRPDGTLWFGLKSLLSEEQYQQNHGNMDSGFVRAGTETNWTAVALTQHGMVALKSDGSLWQLNSFAPWWYQNQFHHPKFPLKRLGIHDDWVAIVSNQGGVVALAADGSLWFWPDHELYEDEYSTLLKLPKQPEFLGNIFGKAD
jgi:ABC-type transport system involved in multi-copper enzyme maturation permease subunit